MNYCTSSPLQLTKHLWMNLPRLSGCGMPAQMTRICSDEQPSPQGGCTWWWGHREKTDTNEGQREKQRQSKPHNSVSFLVTGHESWKNRKRNQSGGRGGMRKQALEESSFRTFLRSSCTPVLGLWGTHILRHTPLYYWSLLKTVCFTHESACTHTCTHTRTHMT